jgi:hypothetical protein
VAFLRLGLSLMEGRLQYSQRETREADKRIAELEAAELERLYHSRF